MEAGTDKQSRTRHIVNTWAASCMHHSSENARPTLPRDTRVLTLQRPHLNQHPVMKSTQRPTHHYRMPDHQSCRLAARETSNLSSRHAHFFSFHHRQRASLRARSAPRRICTQVFLVTGIIVNGSPSSQRVGIIDRHHQHPKINTESHHGNV